MKNHKGLSTNYQRDIGVFKTLEDKKVFLDAILNPPAPNENLKDAKLKHNRFIASSRLS